MEFLKQYGLYILFSCSLVFFGCKKKGCTDRSANNYCEKCEDEDNDECEYTGDGVIWYDTGYADILEASGTDSLLFFIDGELLATMPIQGCYCPGGGIFFPTEPGPNCGDPIGFTFTKNWKSTKIRAFNYNIINQNGTFICDGSIGFEAGKCKKEKIPY